ncbi:hypothetical protein J3R83DRAFT_11863, partial [Lanmaoa asiatica]
PSAKWGVEVVMANNKGNLIFGPNGKPQKTKITMAPARLQNGDPQPLYSPEGHPQAAGWFKGMEQILQEQGYDTKGLKAECKGFKCEPGQKDCCCHCILFTKPDFLNVESLLEIQCHERGFHVIFLPKFHCELNFIEMCWGY